MCSSSIDRSAVVHPRWTEALHRRPELHSESGGNRQTTGPSLRCVRGDPIWSRTGAYRPRVSRETRLLLTAGLLALAALWLLARARFRDLPATPNPIPAVLTQLTNGLRVRQSCDADCTHRSQLDASLLALDAPPASPQPGRPANDSRRSESATTSRWRCFHASPRLRSPACSPAIRRPALPWCVSSATGPQRLWCRGCRCGFDSRAISSPAMFRPRGCRCAPLAWVRSIPWIPRCGPRRSGQCRQAAT